MQVMWMSTGNLQEVTFSGLEVSRLRQNLFYWRVCRPDDRRTGPNALIYQGG